MRELRAVALSEDGGYLVLADASGRADAEQFRVPVDDRLRAALRGARRSEVRTESALTPREIQARLRAGETAADVARAAGIPVERVERYEGPVLAERARVVQEARAALLPKDPGGVPGRPLGEVVDARLQALQDDPEAAQWDAWRRVDGIWLVQLTSETRCARWTWDPVVRRVRPHDEAARALVAPETGDIPPAAPPSAPPSPPPAARPTGPSLTLVHDQGSSASASTPAAAPAASPSRPSPLPAGGGGGYGMPSHPYPLPQPTPLSPAVAGYGAHGGPGSADAGSQAARQGGVQADGQSAGPQYPAAVRPAAAYGPAVGPDADDHQPGYSEPDYREPDYREQDYRDAGFGEPDPAGPAATGPYPVVYPGTPAIRPASPAARRMTPASRIPRRAVPPAASARLGGRIAPGSPALGAEGAPPGLSGSGVVPPGRRPGAVPARPRTAAAGPAAGPGPVVGGPGRPAAAAPSAPAALSGATAATPSAPPQAAPAEPTRTGLASAPAGTPATTSATAPAGTPASSAESASNTAAAAPQAADTRPAEAAPAAAARPSAAEQATPGAEQAATQATATQVTATQVTAGGTAPQVAERPETSVTPAAPAEGDQAVADASGQEPAAAAKDGAEPAERTSVRKTTRRAATAADQTADRSTDKTAEKAADKVTDKKEDTSADKAAADTPGDEKNTESNDPAPKTNRSVTPTNRGRQSGAGRSGERPAGGRRGRKSVPAWDDIVFGARRV